MKSRKFIKSNSANYLGITLIIVALYSPLAKAQSLFHTPFKYASEFSCTPKQLPTGKFTATGTLQLSTYYPASYGYQVFAYRYTLSPLNYVIEAQKVYKNIQGAKLFCSNIRTRLAQAYMWYDADYGTYQAWRGQHNVVSSKEVVRAGQTVKVLRSIRRDVGEVYNYPFQGFSRSYYSYNGQGFITNNKPVPVL